MNRVAALAVSVICSTAAAQDPNADPATAEATSDAQSETQSERLGDPLGQTSVSDGDADAAVLEESAPTTAPIAPPFEHLRVLVIDAGHGGEDDGCVGAAGISEKFLALKMSRRLEIALGPYVERVVMSREDDSYPTLEERTWLANMEEADALISVHFNCAVNTLAHGIETFYLAPDGTVPGDPVPGGGEDPSRLWHDYGVAGEIPELIVDDLRRAGATWRSAVLAEEVQDALIDATGAMDRGVRQAQFRVLRGCRSPAIVAELGFLSHAREGKVVFTGERLEALTVGMVAGLRAYDAWLSAHEGHNSD